MSWVIIHKKTKRGILEIYSDELATTYNQKKGYKAVPIHHYLAGLNSGKYSKD